MAAITPVPALSVQTAPLLINLFGTWPQISIPPPTYSVNIPISTKPSHKQIFN